MENIDLGNWDEERYKELNTYFRIIIEQMLRHHEQLKEQVEQGRSLEMKDIVAQMNTDDQERGEEFIHLDKLKMEVDIWNHLHGKGTPFKPGTGFNKPEDTTW